MPWSTLHHFQGSPRGHAAELAAFVARAAVLCFRHDCAFAYTIHKLALRESLTGTTLDGQTTSYLKVKPMFASFFKVTSLECLSDPLQAKVTSNRDIKFGHFEEPGVCCMN